MRELIVIGGGLAGSEATWQAAKRGVKTALFEMRPAKLTEVHRTGLLGELVCSNSLRSADVMTAPGLLKRELQLAGSLIMRAAEESRVSAGSALAVDRTAFSEYITGALSKDPNIEVIGEEASELPEGLSILATGPLTSRPMTEALGGLIGREYLSFYDAIAPIIDAGSIDYAKVYFASRYGRGGEDYINCPMTREEYEIFLEALREADRVNARAFEKERFFEGCMPVEVMALRGRDTLRFGPMKPVGLPDPKTGREHYAVVQLRAENREGSAYNMVGFQTRITRTEQKRVFRTIPGLEHAEFLRFGSVHRNTFIDGPRLLNEDLTLKARRTLYIAGQLAGVEGYIESTAMGLVAGIHAARRAKGRDPVAVPAASAHGALIRHLTSPSRDFQPSNINFGLFPPVESGKGRDSRKKAIVDRALKDWGTYAREVAE